jgi:hypothetical protein
MGLKTILAKYEQAKKEFEETFGRFLKESDEANAFLEQVNKKNQAIKKLIDEVAEDSYRAQKIVMSLNPNGIKQLTDVKELFVAQVHHSQTPKPIKVDEIRKLTGAMKKQMETDFRQQMEAYADKHAASWPNEVEVGMVFKKLNELIEITEVGIGSYTVLQSKEGGDDNKVINRFTSASMNAKNGWKFIRT